MENARRVKEWHDSWKTEIVEFRGRKTLTLEDIFPPSVDTDFYTEVVVAEAKAFVSEHGRCEFFEMGVGSGVLLLEVSEIDGVSGTGVDISRSAVLCSRVNASIRKIDVKIYESNLFCNVILDREQDFVFWNIPFNRVDPGGVEDVRYRPGFDLGYRYLEEFLENADEHLSPKGCILLGVDNQICDLKMISELISKAGYKQTAIAIRILPIPDDPWPQTGCSLMVLKLIR